MFDDIVDSFCNKLACGNLQSLMEEDEPFESDILVSAAMQDGSLLHL